MGTYEKIENAWQSSMNLLTDTEIHFNYAHDAYLQFGLFDLLLDIYSNTKPLYAITYNHIYEVSTANDLFSKNKVTFSKNTVSKKLAKKIRDDIAYHDYYQRTYAGHFLYCAFQSEDSLLTFSDSILGLIMPHWKHMPFNPHFLNEISRFPTIPSIPANQLYAFLALNDPSGIDDELIQAYHCYCVDHFFNVNLFCNFLYYIQYTFLAKGNHGGIDSAMAYNLPVISALQTLPSPHLKIYFFNVFAQAIRADLSTGSSNAKRIAYQIQLDIYFFSLIFYPLLKQRFLYQLTNGTDNITEEISKTMSHALKKDAKAFLLRYPRFDQDIQPELNHLSQQLIDTVAREVYRCIKLKPLIKYCDDPTVHNAMTLAYHHLGENISDLMWKK